MDNQIIYLFRDEGTEEAARESLAHRFGFLSAYGANVATHGRLLVIQAKKSDTQRHGTHPPKVPVRTLMDDFGFEMTESSAILNELESQCDCK